MCALKLAAYIFFYRIILVHFSILSLRKDIGVLSIFTDFFLSKTKNKKKEIYKM